MTWDARRAEAVARTALVTGVVPGDPSSLRLIRLGTNGVFLAGDAVVRVSPPDEDPVLLAQQIELAGWLADHRFPTPRPLTPDTPVVDGLLVSSWQRVEGRPGDQVDRRALGALLRRFHELTNTYEGQLPEWQPLGRLGTRLDSVSSDRVFTEDDRGLLCRWRDELTAAAASTEWTLVSGPLHGDVHTGNVLVGDDGPVLLDLDRIARGPREWDLTQPVGSTDRFGGREADLDEFMVGYGWDLRSWPKHAALVQLRLLFMTSWLLTLPRTPAVHREIATRLKYWRPGPEAPRWGPV